MKNPFKLCEYILEDGNRCNIKAMQGSPFCVRHASYISHNNEAPRERSLLSSEQYNNLYAKPFRVCSKCGYVQSASLTSCRRCGLGGEKEFEHIPDMKLPVPKSGLKKTFPEIVERLKNPEPEKVKRGLFLSIFANLIFLVLLGSLFLSPAANKESIEPDKKVITEKSKTIQTKAALETEKPAQIPKEEPPKQVSAKVNKEDEVIKMVEMWKTAWEVKNFEKYISFYSKNFKWGNGKGLKSFADHKRITFGKTKDVSVKLKNIEVFPEDDTKVVVTFLQEYKSNLVNDRGAKNLILKKEKGDWKIAAEEFKRFK